MDSLEFTRQQATNYLQQALKNPKAQFRDGQWDSIEALLYRQRALVLMTSLIGLDNHLSQCFSTSSVRIRSLSPCFS